MIFPCFKHGSVFRVRGGMVVVHDMWVVCIGIPIANWKYIFFSPSTRPQRVVGQSRNQCFTRYANPLCSRITSNVHLSNPLGPRTRWALTESLQTLRDYRATASTLGVGGDQYNCQKSMEQRRGLLLLINSGTSLVYVPSNGGSEYTAQDTAPPASQSI